MEYQRVMEGHWQQMEDYRKQARDFLVRFNIKVTSCMIDPTFFLEEKVIYPYANYHIKFSRDNKDLSIEIPAGNIQNTASIIYETLNYIIHMENPGSMDEFRTKCYEKVKDKTLFDEHDTLSFYNEDIKKWEQINEFFKQEELKIWQEQTADDD